MVYSIPNLLVRVYERPASLYIFDFRHAHEVQPQAQLPAQTEPQPEVQLPVAQGQIVCSTLAAQGPGQIQMSEALGQYRDIEMGTYEYSIWRSLNWHS